MHLYKKRKKYRKQIYISVIIFVLCFLFFYNAITNTSDSVEQNEIDNLVECIDNAVISSYATTGVYPESLEEIKEKYGVIIDEEKFIVQYDIVSSNMKPSVTVFIKE